MPGRQRIPGWLTILIGIVAALIGTFAANALGVGDTRSRAHLRHVTPRQGFRLAVRVIGRS